MHVPDGFLYDPTRRTFTCGRVVISKAAGGWVVRRGGLALYHDLDSLDDALAKGSKAAGDSDGLSLADARCIVGGTQEAAAAAMGVRQCVVSEIEAGSNPFVRTLERYARAIGGELEVAVTKGGRRLRLRPFGG